MNSTLPLSAQRAPLKNASAYALLYALAFSHIYYYADVGILPLHSLFQLSSRAHPVVLGVLLFPVSATIALKKHSLSHGRFLPFCLFVLAAALTTIIAYYALTLNAHNHVDDSYVLRSAAALLRYAIFFVAGYYLPTLLRSRPLVLSFYVLYVLVVFHIFVNIDPTVPSMDFRYLSERPGHLRNYQYYADTFALFSLIVIATRTRRSASTAIVIVSTICLFLLISRAAFYGYLIVAAFVLFTIYKGGWRRYVYPALYLFVSYWALLSPGAFQTGSRIATTFSGDLAASASTLSRFLILQRGVDHLVRESWLFGDFRAHYKIFATAGTYIHNYLSLWADYGIVPFSAFISLLLASILYVPRAQALAQRTPSEKPFADVYKYILLFNTILLTGARAHFFPYVFLTFGMLFALRESTAPIAPVYAQSRKGLSGPQPMSTITDRPANDGSTNRS